MFDEIHAKQPEFMPLGPGTSLLELPSGYQVTEAQMDRWYRAGQGHNEWAVRANRNTRFYEGDQWTDLERLKLKQEGRPCLTKNYIARLVRLLEGYFRQNSYDITVLPSVRNGGTRAMADTLTHLIKIISEANQGPWNKAEVFFDGIVTSRGFLDIRLDFSKSYMGDIKERVPDPFSIRIDPEADTYSPSGWNYIIEERWLSISDIFLMYPGNGFDAVETLASKNTQLISDQYYFDDTTERPETRFGLSHLFEGDNYSRIFANGRPVLDHINLNRKTIRALDCQHRVLKQCNYMIDLETGAEKIIPDSWDRAKIQKIMQWMQMRQIPIDIRSGIKKVIRWTTTAGDYILWDNWSPYETFTQIPYFPYFRRGKTLGMVDDLIDPQTEINKRDSARLHVVMTTANSGWMLEENSMEKRYENLLKEEGARAGIVLKYKKGYNKPEKIVPTPPATALKDLIIDNKEDLQLISGMNDSALGDIDRVQSGRAIQARQRQAVIGSEKYLHNFSRSMELAGYKYKELIQGFYTEERIFRLTKDDGDDMQMAINSRNAAGEIENNVTSGNFDIVVDESPASASFLQSQFEEAMRMVEANIAIPPDIIVDLSSMPKKDQIKQRLKDQAMLAQEGAHIQTLGIRGQRGIPPNVPLPPIATGPAATLTPPQAPSPEAALRPMLPSGISE